MVEPENTDLVSLFEDFYEVTGIHSGIWDINYKSIVRVGRDEICSFLHTNKKHQKCCGDCDWHASMQCQKSKKGILYRCHTGFWEYITPVFNENMIVGYANTGMMSDGSPEERETVLSAAEKWGFSREQVREIYDRTPHYSVDHIRSICTIFETCVSHIYCANLIKLNDLGLFQNIETYIGTNIQSDISVEQICDNFSCSRSDLYRLFRRYSESGIAEYIKKTKLEKAKKLIVSTNLQITEIADRVGYSDYSYFSKIFKAAYGVSPRAYRNRLNT